jgi:hypothetical protein
MNDMTDFDKLIKEKAEQATYPYDEAAWRQYKHKAGLRSGYTKYWVIGASSVLVAGAILLLKPNRQVQPSSEEPVQTTVVTNDSVVATQETHADELEDTKTRQASHKTKVSSTQTPHNQTDTLKEENYRVVKGKSEGSRKVVYGKPVVIDVDTITRMVPTDEELEKGHSRLY